MTATLPERTRRFIEHGAPEGQRNAEAFSSAVQMRDAGLSEIEAARLIYDGAAHCGLSEREAAAAVRSAYARPARQPITRTNAPRSTYTPRHRVSAVRLAADAGAQMLGRYAEAFGRKPTLKDFEADFWEKSDPHPLEDWHDDWRLMFAILYDETDWIGIKSTIEGAPTIKRRNDLLRGSSITGSSLFVCLNPVQPGATQLRNADISAWRFLLLENDRCNLDEQAALLAAAPLPIAAIITSGNRSLHAWLRVNAPDESTWRKIAAVVFDRFAPAGFDPKCGTPSRLGRLPGFPRPETKGQQRLLYLASQPKNRGIIPL
jgi:hypothetical protein